MNIGQGMSGMYNKQARDSRAKCQFILDSDYEATYLSAIKHKREHLFLTLIGGTSLLSVASLIDGKSADNHVHSRWCFRQ